MVNPSNPTEVVRQLRDLAAWFDCPTLSPAVLLTVSPCAKERKLTAGMVLRALADNLETEVYAEPSPEEKDRA